MNADSFAVAGLYEYWPGREGAEPVESYTIITTVAIKNDDPELLSPV